MRNLLKVLLIVLLSTLVYAHVGSPDVYYEGDAGPYHLFVTVRLPKVIPGDAEIQIRSATADVQSIQVVLLHLSGPGSELTPAPEVALRSKDDPQFFSSNLWFLELGALQLRIEVDGSQGKAELSIPVASFASQSMPMSRGLRGLLSFLFVFLTLSVVPITGAIVRESSLPPGAVPQKSDRRRSRILMPIVLTVAIIVLYLNRAWWTAEAATYQRNVDLFRPPRAETTLLSGNRLMIRPATQLIVPVPGMEDREVKMDELIPDHGHPMHLFVIALPGMERIWHLHPVLADNGAFAQALPAMPAGRYGLFADIVDKTGFPWTLVGNLEVPQINGTFLTGDDSAWAGALRTSPLSETYVAQLPDGARMIWERGAGPIQANVPASFKFRVENKDGSPARDLEPYMGMAGHVEVVSFDLSVFAHIHPSGSVSMAALDIAQSRRQIPLSEASGMTMPMPMPMSMAAAPLPPDLSFPYGFPQAGEYRIFVQIKRSGQVQTGVFDARVQ